MSNTFFQLSNVRTQPRHVAVHYSVAELILRIQTLRVDYVTPIINSALAAPQLDARDDAHERLLRSRLAALRARLATHWSRFSFLVLRCYGDWQAKLVFLDNYRYSVSATKTQGWWRAAGCVVAFCNARFDVFLVSLSALNSLLFRCSRQRTTVDSTYWSKVTPTCAIRIRRF